MVDVELAEGSNPRGKRLLARNTVVTIAIDPIEALSSFVASSASGRSSLVSPSPSSVGIASAASPVCTDGSGRGGGAASSIAARPYHQKNPLAASSRAATAPSTIRFIALLQN